jgi:hypothetical protein
VWTVGQRLAQLAQQLTNQLNDALFPIVVDSDAGQQQERLRRILVQGTKLSLGLAGAALPRAHHARRPLVFAWVGAQFAESVLPTQILLAVVLVRVTSATANLILKGGSPSAARLHQCDDGGDQRAPEHRAHSPVRPARRRLGTVLPVALSAAICALPGSVPAGRDARGALHSRSDPAGRVAGGGDGALLWFARALEPTGLFQVAVHLGVAGLVYMVLFVAFAITAEERRYYWTKLRELMDRQRRVAAAA